MTRKLLVVKLIFLAALLNLPAHSDQSPLVKLNFNSYDSMTVTDCLRVMSMETGTVILPDKSVNGFVGSINVTKDNVPDMLDFLKTFEPGLTYQIVYYPYSNNEPDGEQLFQDIQAMKSFHIDGLLLPPTGDDNTMLSFRADRYTTPDLQKKAISGMLQIYLVSDPTVRTQMIKETASPQPKVTVPGLPDNRPADFETTVTSLEQEIAKMTPQQQTTAVAELFAAQKQINQGLAPGVLYNVQNGFIPRHPGVITSPNQAQQNSIQVKQ